MYSKKYLKDLEMSEEVLITSDQLHMLTLFYSDVSFVLNVVLDDNILSESEEKGVRRALEYYHNLHDHYYKAWRRVIDDGVLYDHLKIHKENHYVD